MFSMSFDCFCVRPEWKTWQATSQMLRISLKKKSMMMKGSMLRIFILLNIHSFEFALFMIDFVCADHLRSVVIWTPSRRACSTTSKKLLEFVRVISGWKSKVCDVLNNIILVFASLIFIRLFFVKVWRSSRRNWRRLSSGGRMWPVRSWKVTGICLVTGSLTRAFLRSILTAQEWSSINLTDNGGLAGWNYQ